jgi:hypothetical protein
MMRFRCIVSYRSTRSKSLSTWRTSAQGTDVVSVTADIIEKLKRRQRRSLTVVGIYVQLQEKAKA